VVSSLGSHAPDPGDLSRFELFGEQLALAMSWCVEAEQQASGWR
jgi:hypothetical protein